MTKYDRLINKKFGNLTLNKIIGKDSRNIHVLGLFLCDCGNAVEVRVSSVLRGLTTSCKCKQFNKIKLFTERRKTDLRNRVLGKNFSNLLVKEVFTKQSRRSYCKCLCSCGKEIEVPAFNLESGNTKSCGCINNTNRGRFKKNSNISDEKRIRNRHDPRNIKWRKAVWERDNFTCQISGVNTKIVAHHLESYNNNPDLRFIEENGITLSIKVHRQFHNKYGYGNNTKKQFEDFKKNFKPSSDSVDSSILVMCHTNIES